MALQVLRQQSTLKKSLFNLFNARFASTKIKKTPLFDFHVANGGKMTPFAGYHLPLQYGKEGIPQSHAHTRCSKIRKKCAFFGEFSVSKFLFLPFEANM